MKAYKRFLFWFCAEFVLYALVVANGRAYNQANYTATVVTDMCISAFNFYFAKKFINDKDNQDGWSMAGCVLGGATGSVVSILLTKYVYGK
jgi:hypothetical protein